MKINPRNIFQLKQKVHHIGKAFDLRRAGFIAKKIRRRGFQNFRNLIDDRNGNFDFARFILLHGAQGFSQHLRQFSLAETFFLSEHFDPLSDSGMVKIVHS